MLIHAHALAHVRGAPRAAKHPSAAARRRSARWAPEFTAFCVPDRVDAPPPKTGGHMVAAYTGPLDPKDEADLLAHERKLEAEGRRIEAFTFRNPRLVPLPVEVEEAAPEPATAAAGKGGAAAAPSKGGAPAAAAGKKPADAPKKK